MIDKHRLEATRPPNLRIPAHSKEEQKVAQSGTTSAAHLSPLRKSKNEAHEPYIDPELQLKCTGWA